MKIEIKVPIEDIEALAIKALKEKGFDFRKCTLKTKSMTAMKSMTPRCDNVRGVKFTFENEEI